MLWTFSLSKLAADALLCDKQVDCKIRRTRTKRFVREDFAAVPT